MKVISRFSKSLALAAPVVAMTADQVEAAAYIKFDGVDGEVKSEEFNGFVKLDFFKVEIEGVSAGASAKISDFKIGLPMEKASPSLMLACATGQVLKNATLVVTRGQGAQEVPYLQYKLTDVLVSSYSVSGAGQSESVPTESISLNFEKITWTYVQRDPEGNEISRITSPEIPKGGEPR